ncbi:MAG: type II toxin-antitoxin system Phd/YefM family antitoxin [Spirochaetaceae bacterium]
MGIFEIKTRLSEICEEVAQGGESVLVTRRGTPLVRIDPLDYPSTTGSAVWEARERFETDYGVEEDLPEVTRKSEPVENPFDETDT